MSFVACEIDEKWGQGVSKYYINKWLFNWTGKMGTLIVRNKVE